MTFPNLIPAIAGLALSLASSSCMNPPKTTFSISKINSKRSPSPISIIDLAKTFKKFQGLNIETVGRFYFSDEDFSIFAYMDSSTGISKSFWLETNPHLRFNRRSIEGMNGKLIKIRGVIDTTRRGHMNLYLATISGIYFWELQ